MTNPGEFILAGLAMVALYALCWRVMQWMNES